MHRTNRERATALGRLLLGLALGGSLFVAWPGDAVAQQPPVDAAPRGNAITVPINSSQRLRMTTGKAIRQVQNPKENVARVTPIQTDPTAVLITGLEPGSTTVTLTDADGKTETYDVLVQFDIEYLRSLLQRAVPTANILPVPGANNTVILTGYVARAEDVNTVEHIALSVVLTRDRIINALRVGGVQQVQLDVVVARVSREEVRRMSFEFANFGSQHILSNGMGGLVLPSSGISGTFPGAPIILNTINQPNAAPINIFAAVFTPKQDFFAFFQALRDENLVKLVAEPKLVTMSGRPAYFLSGGQQAVPVVSTFSGTGVQFINFGTQLEFLPIVLGNGRIYLEVNPEVSTLDPANGVNIQGTLVAGRALQRIRTSVELEDGQTFAVGGLIQHRVQAGTRKVPLLGDLPFVGLAFSQKIFDEVEEETLVLVTPHLVDAMSCDQVPKCIPGSESRSPDDFELFLEGILEAPRGSREVFPGYKYRPAYKNGPTAAIYPCAGNGNGNGCANGGCASEAPDGHVHIQVAAPAPVAPVVTRPTAPAPVVVNPAAPAGDAPANENSPAPAPAGSNGGNGSN